MADVTFVSSSNAAVAFFFTPTTLNVTAPTSISSGNLLVAVVSTQNIGSPAGSLTSVPSGFVLIDTQTDSAGFPKWLYYKIATGSEPASYAWGVGAGPGYLIAILNYTNTHATTPIDTFAFNISSGGAPSNPVVMPSATPSFGNDFYLAIMDGNIGNSGGGTGYTGPTDHIYADQGSVSNLGTIGVVGRLLSSTAAVQATSWAFNTPGIGNVAWSLLIKNVSPAAGSVTVNFDASTANKPTFATTIAGLAHFVVTDPNIPTFDAAQSSTPNPFNLIWEIPANKPTFLASLTAMQPHPAVIAPIVAMMQYTPVSISTYVARLIAFTLDFLGNAQVIDVSNATWSGSLATYTNAGPVVGGTQFSDSAVFAMGLNIPPQLYRGLPVTPIVNTFQSNTNYPPWLANTQYPRNFKIIAPATPPTATSYIFNAVHGGTSSTSAPSFPSTFHDTVNDNGVVWRNIGAAGPPGPLGAGFVFNHLNSLWVWGTAPTYPQTGDSQGLVGPDGLWMSDEGNPTSYDPANNDFVGQGDGQAAAGGGVWTQLEVGIPATPQLVLFKSNSTYSVLGAFPAVSIANIPDGVGCAAPNTVQFVPNIGLMRLANPGVAVFNGTRDEVDRYTDPIRPYLFPIKGANPDIIPVDWNNILRGSSCQTVNPPGYLMLLPLQNSNGALTRGFFFDRQLRAWTVIDYPFSMPLGCGFYYQRSGAKNRSLFGGFSDGIIREGFAGDEYWDTEPNQPTDWNFRYPPSGAPATPIYVRRSLLRAVLRGSQALINGMRMIFQDANGKEGSTDVIQSMDATNLSSAFDIDRKVLGGFAFDIFGAGRVLVQGLEVNYEPKPPTRIPG